MSAVSSLTMISIAILAGCTNPSSSTPPVPIPPDFYFLWGPDQPGGGGEVTLYLPRTSFAPGTSVTLDNETRAEILTIQPTGDAVLSVPGDVGDHVVVAFTSARETAPATWELDVAIPMITAVSGLTGNVVAGEKAQLSGVGFSLVTGANTIEIDGSVVASDPIESAGSPAIQFTVPAGLPIGAHSLRIGIAGVAPASGNPSYVSAPLSFDVLASLQ